MEGAVQNDVPAAQKNALKPSIVFDQMLLRRLRLAAGLVLLVYLALHMVMHSLGNISFDAMQWGTQFHDLIWLSKPGTALLYGSLLIHFLLALWALYARDSLRMGSGEWARLVLGFSILPLLIHHLAAGRWVYWQYDAQRTYDVVLTVYFKFNSFLGWRQVVVLVVAWAHGCLGLHYWLKPRTWYPRWAPPMLAFAVVLPVVALLGVWQGTREVFEKIAANPEWLKAVVQKGRVQPDVLGPTETFKLQLYWTFAILVGATLLARVVRRALETRKGLIKIDFAGNRVVHVPVGWCVLDASRRARIPHASICGGRGRCTTCRVRVLRGIENLPPPQASEEAALARLGAGSNIRLACQLRPSGDTVVLPLLPANATDDEIRKQSTRSGDSERVVAILFVDIRRSTALAEARLPYDVVFLLNKFFEAVAGGVMQAGGLPNQFLGDGMMAIFGTKETPHEACRQALHAIEEIDVKLSELNRSLSHELSEPLTIGIGVHVGRAILGEIGYRDRHILTAIGDTVHVAARLQDLTKQYNCRAIVSDEVFQTCSVNASAYQREEVEVRGRQGRLIVRLLGNAQRSQ